MPHLYTSLAPRNEAERGAPVHGPPTWSHPLPSLSTAVLGAPRSPSAPAAPASRSWPQSGEPPGPFLGPLLEPAALTSKVLGEDERDEEDGDEDGADGDHAVEGQLQLQLQQQSRQRARLVILLPGQDQLLQLLARQQRGGHVGVVIDDVLHKRWLRAASRRRASPGDGDTGTGGGLRGQHRQGGGGAGCLGVLWGAAGVPCCPPQPDLPVSPQPREQQQHPGVLQEGCLPPQLRRGKRGGAQQPCPRRARPCTARAGAGAGAAPAPRERAFTWQLRLPGFAGAASPAAAEGANKLTPALPAGGEVPAPPLRGRCRLWPRLAGNAWKRRAAARRAAPRGLAAAAGGGESSTGMNCGSAGVL